PGVMCIYGVTQIGRDSAGVSRFLPGLLTALQVLKPAVVFLSGAWLVLHLLNRGTRTAPLTRRILFLLAFLGLVATVDAGLEAAYLVIPKKEELPDAGCCTGAFAESEHAARFVPKALLDEQHRPLLVAAFYGINLGMALTCLGLGTRPRRGGRAWSAALLLGALTALPVSAGFLVEVAAPTLLGLPYHHCPYDLVAAAPESLVGVALYFLGTFAVGWAFLAQWLGDCAETSPF